MIRAERDSAADRAAIYHVHDKAFGRPDEAELVDALRVECVVLLSLVAEMDGAIAGHILFTRVTINAVHAVALAPVAVLPDHQGQGIGSSLIRQGLDCLRERGEHIVLVLGEPGYYTRFGFSTAKARHLRTPFPREAYMALELRPGALDGVAGPVLYAPAFGIDG